MFCFVGVGGGVRACTLQLCFRDKDTKGLHTHVCSHESNQARRADSDLLGAISEAIAGVCVCVHMCMGVHVCV